MKRSDTQPLVIIEGDRSGSIVLYSNFLMRSLLSGEGLEGFDELQIKSAFSDELCHAGAILFLTNGANLKDLNAVIVKKDTNQCPVIVIGNLTLEERVKALKIGADAVLERLEGDGIGLVRAMIEAQTKYEPGTLGAKFFKSFCLDNVSMTLNRRERTVTKADGKISLNKAEFKLLDYLLEHPGEIFSGKKLLKEVFSVNAGTSFVGVVVHRLRNKLGKNIISNPDGYGYGIDLQNRSCE